jgi:hypothetical protein
VVQEWLVRKLGLGRNTIGDVPYNPDRSPTTRTIKKYIKRAE